MRTANFLLLVLALSQYTQANDAFDRLKARYQAFEKGEVDLPELTTPAPIPHIISPTDNLIPTGEELILSVRIGKYALGEVFGIKTEQGVSLSLTDLSSVLDFPIDVDMENEQAEGWVRTPDSHFSLTRQGIDWQTEIGVKSFPTRSSDILVDDDLYIDSHALSQWFDIQLDTNYRELTVDLTSEVPLPVEERILRQQRSEGIRLVNNDARYPLKKHGYSPLSAPLLDIQIAATYSDNLPNTHSVSLLGSNDFAYFNTQYYLATNSDNDIASARLKAGRYSKDADMLGPLNATSVEFGDVRTTQISPLGTSETYLGARLSNEDLGYYRGTSIDLRGLIQPGWDIEIYRNKLLIASQLEVENGEYDFQNLPLVFGANEIELVFYGPQGQISRDVRNYYVSSTGKEAGAFTYDLSIVDEGKRLLNQYNNSSLNEERGLTTNLYTEYGLSDWWTIGAGGKLHQDSEFSNYDVQSFASQLSLFGEALLSVDLLEQGNDDYDRRYKLDTQLDGHSISVSQRETHNSELEENQTVRIQELRLAGRIPNTQVAYQQSFENVNTSTTDFLRVSNQLGTSIGNNYLSNSLDWENNDQNEMTGEWQLQRYLNGYFVRLGNNYDVYPNIDVNSFYAEISGDLSPSTSGRLSFTHDFVTDVDETALTTSWRPNEFSITSRLSYNEHSGWIANFLGQVGIGQSENSTLLSRLPVSTQGAVSARVYHDKNYNQVFDQEDVPLSNVKVISRQSYRHANTNDSGLALLASLPAYRQTDIEIDVTTLPDPYMIRGDEGVSLSPRPGAIQQVDIPVVTSLEIEGYVYELNETGEQKSIAYAPVEIKDESGQVVATTLSEYDGYYLLTDLVPHHYTINIEPEYIQNKHYLSPAPITMDNAQSGVVSNQNLTLRKAFNVKGFSAQLAQFRQLEALRSYWKILSKAHPKLMQYHYFYTRSKQGYQLYIGFSEQPNDAQTICTLLRESSISCQVSNITRL